MEIKASVDVPLLGSQGVPMQPPDPDQIVATMVAIGRFAMAESIARQCGLRPLEVMGVMERYIDSTQGITEVTMAMVVDKSVAHIKAGKGLS
jgi:hypothetical protein